MNSSQKEKEITRSSFLEGENFKITKVFVQDDKLFIRLYDDRDLGIPIDWFEQKWGIENVTPEKLQEYEIWRGEDIFFPRIDEVVGREVFFFSWDAPCD